MLYKNDISKYFSIVKISVIANVSHLFSTQEKVKFELTETVIREPELAEAEET